MTLTTREAEGLRRIRAIASSSTANFSTGGLSPSVAAQLEAIISRELGPAPAATFAAPAVTMAKSDDASVLRKAADSVEAIIAGLPVDLQKQVESAVGILRETSRALVGPRPPREYTSQQSVPARMSSPTAAAVHSTRQQLADAQGLLSARVAGGKPFGDLDATIAELTAQLERQTVAFSQQVAATPPADGKVSDAEVQRLIGVTASGNAQQQWDKVAQFRDKDRTRR